MLTRQIGKHLQEKISGESFIVGIGSRGFFSGRSFGFGEFVMDFLRDSRGAYCCESCYDETTSNASAKDAKSSMKEMLFPKLDTEWTQWLAFESLVSSPVAAGGEQVDLCL